MCCMKYFTKSFLYYQQGGKSLTVAEIYELYVMTVPLTERHRADFMNLKFEN